MEGVVRQRGGLMEGWLDRGVVCWRGGLLEGWLTHENSDSLQFKGCGLVGGVTYTHHVLHRMLLELLQPETRLLVRHRHLLVCACMCFVCGGVDVWRCVYMHVCNVYICACILCVHACAVYVCACMLCLFACMLYTCLPQHIRLNTTHHKYKAVI